MSGLYAQSNDLQKQANNPLANMSSLNFHNYYAPKLTDSPSDSYMNTAWVRFAQPIAGGKFLLRVSAPIPTMNKYSIF